MKAALTVLLTLLLTASLQAGIFCNRCRSHNCRCVKTYSAPVAYQAPSTNVYVVQQNYPQPLVAQGSSLVYGQGLQSQMLPYYDPNIVASGTMEVTKALAAMIPLTLERSQAFSERMVSYQSKSFNVTATGNAAALALTAAAAPQGLTAASTTGIAIKTDAYGKVTLEPLPAAAPTPAPEFTPTPDQISTNYPVVQANCAKCHGVEVAQPGGGLYLGDDPQVAAAMKTRWFDLSTAVDTGKMPKGHTMTQPDKIAVLNELAAMIRNATNPVSKE